MEGMERDEGRCQMKKQQVLKDLRMARAAATMENAGFHDMGGSMLARFSNDGVTMRTMPVEETEYIRERTKLYRESWIIGMIDAAIAEIEREPKPRRVR